MRICVMMRAMDQDSGFRGYIEGLIDSMLSIDHENEYLLFYRAERFFGRFAGHANAHEQLLRAPHKLAWDQIAVPYAAWKQGADVIFNPKFSVPLLSHCPVVMGLQEPDWWVEPECYEKFDLLFAKTMLPLYCRKASHLLPMSQFNLDESRKYLRLPLEPATVTYTCPGKHMRPIEDRAALQSFREKWQLPERFIAALTRVDHPGLDGFEKLGFYGGKNPEAILRAFLLCKAEVPHDLVFAGRRVRDYMRQLGFRDADFERVQFIDFIPYEELPMLYNLAAMSVVTAYYDGCSTTMLESMACGCPVVASSTGGCPEVGADAALYVDPRDPADIARKLTLLAQDPELVRDLRSKLHKRAEFFAWERTARATLGALQQAAGCQGA